MGDLKTENIKNNPSFYVGIGASAGGLEALEKFFKNMPSNTNLAFIVIQHLSPDYKSMMVELLSRHTNIKVVRAEDSMPVIANHIYLIPPKHNMTIFKGKLILKPQDNRRTLNLPIDIFFRSLAMDQGKKSIGIILSGTGSDGTLGIRSIKEVGGMAMSQDDVSAKFDGMPKSAIATTLIDYILPPEKMPQELIKYIQHPYINKKEKADGIMLIGETVLESILEILKNQLDVDFNYYKPNTIIRRLERRLSINQINKLEHYISLLNQSPKELNILYKELLIGVTQFFRDKEAYEELREKIIPQIIKSKTVGEIIRIWIAGCSTGEEAYSLALLFKEYMDKQNVKFDVKIFATDLDKEAIEKAGVGIYPESIISDIPEDLLSNYFLKQPKGYIVSEEIRQMVIFAPQNLTKDPPFSKIDMVSCRNVLIYLKPEMQKKILSMFHFSLNNNGYLFLGSSESLGNMSSYFNVINSKWKIFKYKENLNPTSLKDIVFPQLKNYKSATGNMPKPILTNGFIGTKRNNYLETVYEQILNNTISPAVLVNEQFEIIQIFGNLNNILHIPAGKVSWNILKIIRNDLAILLSSILHKVLKEKKEIVYQNIKLKNNIENEQISISLTAKYIFDKPSQEAFVIISFKEEKKENTQIDNSNLFSIDEQYTNRIKELERELQVKEETLQTTLEEMETSNEELQATNEELIASNEELQSTNEELQSVNEELYTVNSEYHNKIEELTIANNDINNLLKNTNIGTLFLDNKLRIRKFTGGIQKIMNILDIDIGRPISHISLNTIYANLIKDINEVMENLIPKQLEITDEENKWHLLRIQPYRTEDNAINGVIITMVDINNLKIAQNELKREKNLLYRILDNSNIAKTIVNKNGYITYANTKAEQLLGLKKSELKNKTYNDTTFNIEDVDGNTIDSEKLPFSIIMKTHKGINNYIHCIKWKNNYKKTLKISGEPIFDEYNNVEGIVFNIEDI